MSVNIMRVNIMCIYIRYHTMINRIYGVYGIYRYTYTSKMVQLNHESFSSKLLLKKVFKEPDDVFDSFIS